MSLLQWLPFGGSCLIFLWTFMFPKKWHCISWVKVNPHWASAFASSIVSFDISSTVNSTIWIISAIHSVTETITDANADAYCERHLNLKFDTRISVSRDILCYIFVSRYVCNPGKKSWNEESYYNTQERGTHLNPLNIRIFYSCFYFNI